MALKPIHYPYLAAVFTGLLLLTLTALYVARPAPGPNYRIDDLQSMVFHRRFDEAERRLAEYLSVQPLDPRANLLFAQVALDRPDQKPELALERLARIKTQDPRLKAIVLLNEGKAFSTLGENDRAERAWKAALKLDPTVPEAGWALLSAYYVQGRRDEAHWLGLYLHRIEPDRRDRANLLLELIRQDAHPITLERLIDFLQPLVTRRPQDLQTSLALGLAMVRNSRLNEGLTILRDRATRKPDEADAWNALLLGLDEAGEFDELAQTLARLPARFATDSRFERFRGAAAQHRLDWTEAVAAYQRAWQADPSDLRVLYRMSRVLRAAGRTSEANQFDKRVQAAQEAKKRLLPLYEEASAVKTLGVAPHADLYQRLANLREALGRDDEAAAWHRLVLRDHPDDQISTAALARLEKSSGSNTPAIK